MESSEECCGSGLRSAAIISPPWLCLALHWSTSSLGIELGQTGAHKHKPTNGRGLRTQRHYRSVTKACVYLHSTQSQMTPRVGPCAAALPGGAVSSWLFVAPHTAQPASHGLAFIKPELFDRGPISTPLVEPIILETKLSDDALQGA